MLTLTDLDCVYPLVGINLSDPLLKLFTSLFENDFVISLRSLTMCQVDQFRSWFFYLLHLVLVVVKEPSFPKLSYVNLHVVNCYLSLQVFVGDNVYLITCKNFASYISWC